MNSCKVEVNVKMIFIGESAVVRTYCNCDSVTISPSHRPGGKMG